MPKQKRNDKIRILATSERWKEQQLRFGSMLHVMEKLAAAAITTNLWRFVPNRNMKELYPSTPRESIIAPHGSPWIT